MDIQIAFLSELTLLGVPDSVTRLTREITPAQEGLLDCTNHVDAQQLLVALDWMTKRVSSLAAAVDMAENANRVAKIKNFMAWLEDVVDERG